MKNGRWLDVVIFLVGLLMGGGAAASVGHYQYTKMEKRLSDHELRYYTALNEINGRLARIEGKLEK